MSSIVTYRAAGPADTSAVYDLVCELAVYEKLAHEVVSTPKHFEAILSSPDRFFCYMAERDGQALGLCIGFYTLSTFLGKPGLYIEDVYVKESARGLGIGKAFFKIVAQRAVDEGCGRIEWSVLDWNEPSIKFYDKMGAKPLTEWIKYRLDSDGIQTIAGQ